MSSKTSPENSPRERQVLLACQANQQPRESSAGALQQLAATGGVCSDENNFPVLELLTSATWRPPGLPANNNSRAGWDRVCSSRAVSCTGGSWPRWAPQSYPERGNVRSHSLQCTARALLPSSEPTLEGSHPHGDGQLGQGQCLPWGEMSGSRAQIHTGGGT